jgi:lipoyl(octanoyl) transferase
MTTVMWEVETDPAHAMARDEVALDKSARGTSWFRFYRWFNPALTAGVFCHLTIVPPIPWARRITGGGLVLHGNDLTFTVITDDQPNKSAYRNVGVALVNALHEVGIDAELKKDTKPLTGTYACFSEPVEGDVVVEGRKLAGYAMRRRRGRILLQGSLALSIPLDELLRIVSAPLDYRCNSISLSELLLQQDAAEDLSNHIAKEISQSFPCAQNFNQMEGLGDKITEQYMKKYSDPALEPARR